MFVIFNIFFVSLSLNFSYFVCFMYWSAPRTRFFFFFILCCDSEDVLSFISSALVLSIFL